MILKDRRECRLRLMDAVKTGDDKARTQARKLLALHYKIGVDDAGREHRVSRMSCISEQLTGCTECGRLPGGCSASPSSISGRAGLEKLEEEGGGTGGSDKCWQPVLEQVVVCSETSSSVPSAGLVKEDIVDGGLRAGFDLPAGAASSPEFSGQADPDDARGDQGDGGSRGNREGDCCCSGDLSASPLRGGCSEARSEKARSQTKEVEEGVDNGLGSLDRMLQELSASRRAEASAALPLPPGCVSSVRAGGPG